MVDNVKEVTDWFTSIKGKNIDMDNFPVGNEAQCVDVPKHFYKAVLGGQPGTFGNGKDVAFNLGKLDAYTYYAPGTTRVQPGDTISFGKPLGQVKKSDGRILDYGHVGVCIERVNDSTVAVIDQDGFSSKNGVHRSEFPMNYITGIARPNRYLTTSKTTSTPTPTSSTYKITPSDTLWSLSKKWGTTVDAITAVNPGIEPENLVAGQVINVPGKTYTVAKGDTLSTIAKTHGKSLTELITLNGIKDANTIYVGQVIKLS